MPPPRKKIMTFIYYNKIIKHIKSIKSTFLIIKNNNKKITLLSITIFMFVYDRLLWIVFMTLHICLVPILTAVVVFFSHIIGFFTLEDFDFQALILNIFYRVVLLSLKWKNKQKRNKNCVLLPLMNCPLMPYISHCWKYIKHYNTTTKLHCNNSYAFLS